MWFYHPLFQLFQVPCIIWIRMHSDPVRVFQHMQNSSGSRLRYAIKRCFNNLPSLLSRPDFYLSHQNKKRMPVLMNFGCHTATRWHDYFTDIQVIPKLVFEGTDNRWKILQQGIL